MLNSDYVYSKYYKPFLDRLISDEEFLQKFKQTFTPEEASVDGPFNGSLSISIEYNHPATQLLLDVLQFPDGLSLKEKIALYGLGI